MNTFGQMFRITSFGESHGDSVGVVVDGMPSGTNFNEETLKTFLNRRRPGGALVSSRAELDAPQILSGVFENKFLGTPVSCTFKNKDARSEDYKNLKPRTGHADQVWMDKYEHVDLRGGGRSSGRETLSRVTAGAFAKMFFDQHAPQMQVRSFTKSIFTIFENEVLDKDLLKPLSNQLGFVSSGSEEKAVNLLLQAKEEGQSYGGEIEVRVLNPLKSLGEPVFGKIKSRLAEACLSIGAVKSFSLGDEVDFSNCKGTEFHKKGPGVYGGVLGGITTGETIKFSVGVKPTSSIMNVAKKGRHDPCIIPRVRVVLESMVYNVLMDLYLQHNAKNGVRGL